MTKKLMLVGIIVWISVVILVGCGPKPPCPVGPEAVKQAQDQTAKIEAELNAATAERSQLEQELSQKQARLEELKNKPELLMKELEALKKGSGR